VLNLAEYRRRADRLADHLPWAALVAPGIVLNKDGSFQRTARFRGPDLESATEAELIAACARVNNVLKRFGSGWALHFEAEITGGVPGLSNETSDFGYFTLHEIEGMEMFGRHEERIMDTFQNRANAFLR